VFIFYENIVPPEPYIGPSESTPEPAPEQHQTCAHWPASNLHRLKHIRLAGGTFRAYWPVYSLTYEPTYSPPVHPTMKHPKKDVRCKGGWVTSTVPAASIPTGAAPVDTPVSQERFHRSTCRPSCQSGAPRSLTGANQEAKPHLRVTRGSVTPVSAAPTFLCHAGSRAPALVPVRLLNWCTQDESCPPAGRGSDNAAQPCDRKGGSLSPVAGVRPARSPEAPSLQT
jgi:hypothetical protein